jgi:hypothetical protein
MEDGNLPMGQVPGGMPVEYSLEIAGRLVSGLQDMTRPIKRALNTYHASWLPDGREHLPVAEHHHPGVAGDPRRPRPPGSGPQADPDMRLARCLSWVARTGFELRLFKKSMKPAACWGERLAAWPSRYTALKTRIMRLWINVRMVRLGYRTVTWRASRSNVPFIRDYSTFETVK